MQGAIFVYMSQIEMMDFPCVLFDESILFALVERRLRRLYTLQQTCNKSFISSCSEFNYHLTWWSLFILRLKCCLYSVWPHLMMFKHFHNKCNYSDSDLDYLQSPSELPETVLWNVLCDLIYISITYLYSYVPLFLLGN